jgi:hypothetical protein
MPGVPKSTVPNQPGWYPDPYSAASVRWFDGSQWTTHAVPSASVHPDEVVERHADGRSPEERREEEWKSQFPWWDTAIAQGTEPPYSGGGGARGYYINQLGRFDSRFGTRLRNWPVRTPGWTFALAGVLVLMALIDAPGRPLVIALAALSFLVSLWSKIKALRDRRHWKRVGQQD